MVPELLGSLTCFGAELVWARSLWVPVFFLFFQVHARRDP
jgi:hypothetical protein